MKRYCIADLIVEMETFGRTAPPAEPYRSSVEGPAAITISSYSYHLLFLKIRRFIEYERSCIWNHLDIIQFSPISFILISQDYESVKLRNHL